MTTVSQLIAEQANANMNKSTWGSIAVNVKAFGATGNGAADDTKMIQTAIDYARSLGKSEVAFPAGTYLYGVLTNTEGMTFLGDGVTLNGTTPITITSLATIKVETEQQLSNKANQSDLITTNNAVLLKADKSYVDTQISAIGNGSPKGTYGTLAALQAAYPTGTTGIFVITADGKWYYWNGTTWTSGGTYQSAGVADKSINIDKLSTDVSNPITEYKKMSYSILAGQYYNIAGSLGNSAGYQCLKVPCIPGEKLRCDTIISGDATAMAVFFGIGGTIISFLNQGVNGVNTPYVNYEFTVPNNVYFVAINGISSATVVLGNLRVVEVRERLEAIESVVDTHWRGKTAVWFGTSIPAGGTTKYPSMVASKLGMTITNEAMGSSMARNGQASKVVAGTDPYGWEGLVWQNVVYSLSQTIAEKQYLIDNWATWRMKLTNSPPATLSEGEKSFFKDCSYENRLVARHLGANRKDLYIFDHGHNDDLFGNDILTMPTNTRDRGYFLGAMNYLIDVILRDNPRARICFIGHYENARKGNISQAQETLAEYWDFPLCKLWKKLGWTQQTVTTTGYWGVDGIWVPSGGSSQSLTLTQIWMQDDLHPQSDLSGTANKLIADTLAPWLATVR